MGAGAEGLGGGQLALDFLHPGVVAGARHFQTADTGVMAHLLEEIDRVLGRPDRKIVVAGRVAEVGGVRRRTDVGRDARLVDADDIVPSALDQMMGDRSADDTAEPDDYDFRFLRKLRHCIRP